MLDVDDGKVVLTGYLSFLEMVLQLSPEVFRSVGEYRPVAKVLIAAHQEDDIYELLLHSWHQRELETIPGSELQRKGLLGENSHVLLELLLAEIRGKVESGDGGPALALN